VVTEASVRHQRITLELALRLTNWLRENPGHGEAGIPVNVHLDDFNVFAPDVWWVPEASRPARDAKRMGPPALAVEVRSPSTWRYDIGTKRASYERHGVRELWLVDTEANSVLVYRRSTTNSDTFDVALELEADEVLSTPLIPGFSLDLAELFAL
jgi:Uma2 family endonuclease